MPSFSSLISLGLLASTAMTAPLASHKHKQKRTSSGEVAVYWGSNTATATENSDLSAYCSDDAGIDILILSFLNTFGSSSSVPTGTIGKACSITSSGATGCSDLGTQITTCQNNGVKVLISLGGEDGSYSVSSESQGSTLATYLWEAYGPSSSGSSSNVTRPFGDAVIDGFDFDIEVGTNAENSYYTSVISTLRSKFESDSSKSYYISGAPQCPLPNSYMNSMISGAQFDYLFIQFYNNPSCSNGGTINFDDWVTFISNTSSSDAMLFLGVPASTTASTNTDAGAAYYFTPSELSSEVSQISSSSHFGGIMMWDAAFSDANVIDGKTYAQQAAAILGGSSVGGSSSAAVQPTATPTAKTGTATASAHATTTHVATATASHTVKAITTSPFSTPVATPGSSSSSSSTTVAVWGQCGGIGYSGSTTCASGSTCTEESSWWSYCKPTSD